jgi:transposase
MAETDETYSAKQVARRIGTDAKTFRKWLRSTASPYPAVGQGQRYEFPAEDLDRIQKFFDAWKTRSNRRGYLPPVNGKPVPQHKLAPAEFAEELKARGKARDEEYGTVDGEYPDEEPTPEDLEELEDLDLDLDDLDD